MSSLLNPRSLLENGPRGLTHAVERTLWHLGFSDVRVIDGRDDGGADLLAVRAAEQWIVQCKWSGRAPLGRTGIDDCERAKAQYGADRCVLVTNARLGKAALQRRQILARVGIKIDVWDGATLAALCERMPDDVPTRPLMRDYQDAAVTALRRDLQTSRTALLILATGLGKTAIAGEVIREHLDRNPTAKILAVAHLRELVDQLERAVWKHLNKNTPTQVLSGESRPRSFEGVTFATIDSALGLVVSGYRPELDFRR